MPPYVITATFLLSLAYPTLPPFNVLNHKQQLSHLLKGSLDCWNAYFDDLAHLTGRKDKQIKRYPPIIKPIYCCPSSAIQVGDVRRDRSIKSQHGTKSKLDWPLLPSTDGFLTGWHKKYQKILGISATLRQHNVAFLAGSALHSHSKSMKETDDNSRASPVCGSISTTKYPSACNLELALRTSPKVVATMLDRLAATSVAWPSAARNEL